MSETKTTQTGEGEISALTAPDLLNLLTKLLSSDNPLVSINDLISACGLAAGAGLSLTLQIDCSKHYHVRQIGSGVNSVDTAGPIIAEVKNVSGSHNAATFGPKSDIEQMNGHKHVHVHGRRNSVTFGRQSDSSSIGTHRSTNVHGHHNLANLGEIKAANTGKMDSVTDVQ